MMPASFTGYVMTLLQQCLSVLDGFLTMMADAVVFGDGVGNGALSLFKSVTGVIGLFLALAIVWNVMEGAVAYSKNFQWPWENFKKAFHALIIGFLMMGARSAYYSAKTGTGFKNGSYYDISYSGMTAGVTDTALQPALNALATVDIPQAWAVSLYQYNETRRDKILAAMSAQDPAVAATYQNRLLYAKNGGKQVGLDGSRQPSLIRKALSTASLAWDVGKDLLNGTVDQIVARSLVNWVVGFCILVGVWICEFVFVLFAARTILILAFYIKLASFLAILVLPPALGTLYFPAIRDYGIRAIRQIVVLCIVSGTLSGAIQVVFSQDAVKVAMAEALRGALGPIDGPVTQEDIQTFQTMTDLQAAETVAGADTSHLSEFDIMENLFSSLTVKDFFSAALCAIKMMMMLGALLMVLTKLYELILGAFEGDFDPLREGKKAAG